MFWHRFHTVFLLFAALILLGHPARAQESVFTVGNIKVDVTADSAVAAREQAFAKAQQDAFKQLAARLLSGSEMKNFQPPPDFVISSLVNDFEITDEKLSSVEYIATYTFRFKDADVRAFLNGKGLTYTDVGSKPVLVLPFWKTAQSVMLWGDGNPWMTAWMHGKTWQGLVPSTVPLGDAQDRADVGDPASTKMENLSTMMGRYGAGEAVVMIASPTYPANALPDQAPDKIVVSVYSTDALPPKLVKTLAVPMLQGDTQATMLDRAVKEARDYLQDEWKNRTMASTEQSNSLDVRVRFSSMQEWIDTQKILRSVQGVNEVKLLSLKPGEASVRLKFQGDEAKLRLALAQSDLTLTAPQISFGQPSGAPLVYDLYLSRYRPAAPSPAPVPGGTY